MAVDSEISWTENTFNSWWGCTKIAPGCDHCYAESFNRRFNHADYWDPHVTPRVMSDANWRHPLTWNRKALAAGVRTKVFCGSMCDWADNNAPEGQRNRLWRVIVFAPIES